MVTCSGIEVPRNVDSADGLNKPVEEQIIPSAVPQVPAALVRCVELYQAVVEHA